MARRKGADFFAFYVVIACIFHWTVCCQPSVSDRVKIMKSERRKAFVAVYEKNINSGRKSAYRNIMDPCDAMCYYCQEKGVEMSHINSWKFDSPPPPVAVTYPTPLDHCIDVCVLSVEKEAMSVLHKNFSFLNQCLPCVKDKANCPLHY